MLGKRPRPIMGKLYELFVSGNRAGFLDVSTSPRSPLDLKMQSPRGLKNYDVGGVGLGIVAALDKSSAGGRGRDILVKHAISRPSSNRSDPNPVNCERFRGELESLENFTYVTCHAPNNNSFTKVYYDGGEYGNGRSGDQRNESPAQFVEDIWVFPTSEFLSSCNLCKKKLHGKDIYIYRGEKAFCSTECRSSQIMIDERKEQCRSKASRSADVSNLPYTRSQIFSTGILAI